MDRGDKFRPSPPVTASEDYSEFINAGVPSMFFNIGVHEPERVGAAHEGEGAQLPGNHSPLFAPVLKPTIETAVEAMTLAVLSVFDQHARENKLRRLIMSPALLVSAEEVIE